MAHTGGTKNRWASASVKGSASYPASGSTFPKKGGSLSVGGRGATMKPNEHLMILVPRNLQEGRARDRRPTWKRDQLPDQACGDRPAATDCKETAAVGDAGAFLGVHRGRCDRPLDSGALALKQPLRTFCE